MFFAKRSHAIKIIEQLGFPIRSVETTTLVDIVLEDAKQFAEMIKASGHKPNDLDCVLMSIGSARTNQSAVLRLQRDAFLDQEEARLLLHQVTAVAKTYAYQTGRVAVADKFLNTAQ